MFSKSERFLRLRAIPIAIITIFSLIIYSNSFLTPFILDDFSSISNNYSIINPADIRSIWGFYPNRFIIYFTFSINYFIHDNSVIGYHIVNLLIHALNGLLVFLIFKTLLSLDCFNSKTLQRFRYTISMLAALIFISHPIQINAVTYIVQRTAALAGTFYFLSILFFLKYRMQDKCRYFILTMLFIILAMFTKENTITIPFTFALIEIMFFSKDNKTSWKKRSLFLIIIFLTLPIIPVVNKFGHFIGGYNQSDPNAIFKASTNMSRLHYFYTELNVIIHYIKLLFIPDRLNFDYSNDYNISKTIWANHSYISLIILSIIGLYGILNFKKNKLISLGILWFFIGLSVESSIISIKDVYFEHRLYFPVVGFILFLVGIIFSSGKIFGRVHLFKKPLLFYFVFASIFILSNSAVTLYRNYIFSDSIRLWSDVTSKAPLSDRAHCTLGGSYLNAYQDGGNKNNSYLSNAEKELKMAIDMNYNNDTAHCNLAKVYYLMKRYDDCIDEARTSNRLSASVYAYQNIGLAYKKLGKTKGALDAFLAGYNLDKKCSFILKSLAETYYESKDYKNAQIYYEKLVSADRYYKSDAEVNKRLNELKKLNEDKPR